MEERYLCKAKRTDNGEWVVGSLISMPYGGYMIDCVADSRRFRVMVNPSTICQCTGLKDKNDKLIWENDIVDFLGHKGVIKYECGSFGIAYKNIIDWDEIKSKIMSVTGCDNDLYACENDYFISLWEIYWNFNDKDDSVDTVEAIGNIFDNKDLLESEE